MIVVEGMDNTGKTTLVNKLAEEFDLKVVKSPGPVDQGLENSLKWMQETLENKDLQVIYDRYPLISERIYGPIIRKKDILAPYWDKLVRKFLLREPLLIYCRPPIKDILNFGEREQMEGVIERAEELAELYDEYMKWFSKKMGTRFVVYNYRDSDSYTNVRNRVSIYLNLRRFIDNP